jgi:N-acetylglutamate synthase-like GNAT family acetyltransferase
VFEALATLKTMCEIYIKPAIVSEVQKILDIQKEAYLSEAEIYDDYHIPPLTQTLKEIELDFENHKFYVAKLAGRIVGSVNIKVEGNTGHIGRLIVAPNIQNQGIGSMLMDYVESAHSELEAFELFTGHRSERNLSFYIKRGYQEFKRQRVHKNLLFIFMRKKIANKSLQRTSR